MPPVQIIHRFWAGSPIPPEYEAYGRKWEELNPGWKVHTWTETSAIALVHDPDLQEVLADLYIRDDGRLGIELYVQLADVLGYVLVEKFGGIYVNCDIEPVRPLPALPDIAWASYENTEDWRIVNAAIGAPNPHDRFWRGLLQGLPTRYFSDPYAEMVMSTGPGYLTDFAANDLSALYVYPVQTFNPIHWKSIPEGGDASGFSYPEDTIGVHHWGHKKDHRSNIIETATQR